MVTHNIIISLPPAAILLIHTFLNHLNNLTLNVSRALQAGTRHAEPETQRTRIENESKVSHGENYLTYVRQTQGLGLHPR